MMSLSFLLRHAASGTYLGKRRLEMEMRRRRLGDQPRQMILDSQLQQLNAVWSRAASHVPHYIDLKNRFKLPDHFPDIETFFASVPPLHKAEVQENPHRFLSQDAGPGQWVTTSGSTGRPMRFFRGASAHHQIRLDFHYHNRQWNVEWHHPQLLLWGDESHFQKGFSGRMHQLQNRVTARLKNRFHVNAYFLDPDSLTHCHALLSRGSVRMIYAYSQAALRLADFCQTRVPPVGLRLVVVSAEYVDAQSIAAMKKVFRCPVVREYGANETGIIAVDLPNSSLCVMEHRLLLETPMRVDGMHEIQVTCLDNPDYPLLRYRMEDLTPAPMLTPDQGASRLEDIHGRINDLILLPDGKWLHSAYVTHAVRSVAPMKRFQIVQKRADHIHLRLETNRPLTTVEKKQIRDRIHRLASGTVRVTITEKEAFEITPMGKHKFVIRHGGSPLPGFRL